MTITAVIISLILCILFGLSLVLGVIYGINLIYLNILEHVQRVGKYSQLEKAEEKEKTEN